MEKLITPFGKIKILIDGKEVPYLAKKGTIDDIRYPDILGIYAITVSFTPDGKEHSIACVFEPNCSYERYIESGERLECQGFYNDQKYKMSIGIEVKEEYQAGYDDYDAEYLKNGVAYLILPDTKTNRYVFGIAWIDRVDDDTVGDNKDRDTQTWFAADPTQQCIGDVTKK
jgi:hypothetical protein